MEAPGDGLLNQSKTTTGHPAGDREKWPFRSLQRGACYLFFYAYCSMTIRNTFKIYQHSVNKNSRLPRKGGSKLGIGEHLGDDGKCEKTHLYPIPGVPRVLPLFLFPQSLNYRTYMSIGINHRKGS